MLLHEFSCHEKQTIKTCIFLILLFEPLFGLFTNSRGKKINYAIENML